MNTHKQMWFGNHQAVEVRRIQYKNNKLSITCWASTLYSFRYIKRYRTELFDLYTDLYNKAATPLLMDLGNNSTTKDKIEKTNQTDILSTIFFWMSKNTTNSTDESEMLMIAYDLVDYGLNIANNLPETCLHTKILLQLTKNELDLKSGIKLSPFKIVDCYLTQIDFIKDANQKARAYRKAGIIFRKLKMNKVAFSVFLKSCLVPHSALGVRVKSFVALLGFTDIF